MAYDNPRVTLEKGLMDDMWQVELFSGAERAAVERRMHAHAARELKSLLDDAEKMKGRTAEDRDAIAEHGEFLYFMADEGGSKYLYELNHYFKDLERLARINGHKTRGFDSAKFWHTLMPKALSAIVSDPHNALAAVSQATATVIEPPYEGETEVWEGMKNAINSILTLHDTRYANIAADIKRSAGAKAAAGIVKKAASAGEGAGGRIVKKAASAVDAGHGGVSATKVTHSAAERAAPFMDKVFKDTRYPEQSLNPYPIHDKLPTLDAPWEWKWDDATNQPFEFNRDTKRPAPHWPTSLSYLAWRMNEVEVQTSRRENRLITQFAYPMDGDGVWVIVARPTTRNADGSGIGGGSWKFTTPGKGASEMLSDVEHTVAMIKLDDFKQRMSLLTRTDASRSGAAHPAAAASITLDRTGIHDWSGADSARRVAETIPDHLHDDLRRNLENLCKQQKTLLRSLNTPQGVVESERNRDLRANEIKRLTGLIKQIDPTDFLERREAQERRREAQERRREAQERRGDAAASEDMLRSAAASGDPAMAVRAKPYNKIWDPVTGAWLSVRTQEGKNLLRMYADISNP